MDRLDSMRAFQRGIDEGGFAAAARSLDISPAVVTRLVADLEEHMGTRLLHRMTRRVSLTQDGENSSTFPHDLGRVRLSPEVANRH
jgi:DNA-binding transcriptional LysR family regulator